MDFIGMGSVWHTASDLHRGQSKQRLSWLLARKISGEGVAVGESERGDVAAV